MTNFVAGHFARHLGPVRPSIVTKRGWSLSVQASGCHYCTPREDVPPGAYTRVEVYCWKGRPPKWLRPYTSGNDPAGWVPVDLVNRWVRKGGGLA